MGWFAGSGASASAVGATNPTRYVGGETSGAPVSGTFAVGDYVVDADGSIWVCTVAGSPGTWVNSAFTGAAPLASPTFTGTPAAPTAAVDTNTTQIATTAMVLAQAAAATPLVDAVTAVVGTSTRFARADHVHPFPAYATYTPTWTSSGTAPAIGNAGITARYIQIGKMVHCYGQITFGTTSTYGTGSYTFALPVTAAASAAGTQMVGGKGRLLQNSSGNLVLPFARVQNTTIMDFVYGATYNGVATAVGQLAPWTWTTSDQLCWNFVYEAA